MTELQQAIAAITPEQMEVLRSILPGVTMQQLYALARVPLLQLALRFLLYERQEETAMRAMVEGLITERHSDPMKNHNLNVPWWECRNQVCSNAKLLMDDAKKQSVEINNFAIQLMNRYDVKFDAVGDQEIKMRLVDKLQDSKTDPTQQQPSGIILP